MKHSKNSLLTSLLATSISTFLTLAAGFWLQDLGASNSSTPTSSSSSSGSQLDYGRYEVFDDLLPIKLSDASKDANRVNTKVGSKPKMRSLEHSTKTKNEATPLQARATHTTSTAEQFGKQTSENLDSDEDFLIPPLSFDFIHGDKEPTIMSESSTRLLPNRSNKSFRQTFANRKVAQRKAPSPRGFDSGDDETFANRKVVQHKAPGPRDFDSGDDETFANRKVVQHKAPGPRDFDSGDDETFANRKVAQRKAHSPRGFDSGDDETFANRKVAQHKAPGQRGFDSGDDETFANRKVAQRKAPGQLGFDYSDDGTFANRKVAQRKAPGQRDFDSGDDETFANRKVAQHKAPGQRDFDSGDDGTFANRKVAQHKAPSPRDFDSGDDETFANRKVAQRKAPSPRGFDSGDEGIIVEKLPLSKILYPSFNQPNPEMPKTPTLSTSNKIPADEGSPLSPSPLSSNEVSPISTEDSHQILQHEVKELYLETLPKLREPERTYSDWEDIVSKVIAKLLIILKDQLYKNFGLLRHNRYMQGWVHDNNDRSYANFIKLCNDIEKPGKYTVIFNKNVDQKSDEDLGDCLDKVYDRLYYIVTQTMDDIKKNGQPQGDEATELFLNDIMLILNTINALHNHLKAWFG